MLHVDTVITARLCRTRSLDRHEKARRDTKRSDCFRASLWPFWLSSSVIIRATRGELLRRCDLSEPPDLD